MTRLIDADDLEKTLHEIIVKKGFTFSHGNGDFSLVISSENLKDLITNAPTIEADSGEAICYVSNVVLKSILDKNAGLVPIWYEKDLKITTPLYTSPQKREWVSLTSEQLAEVLDNWDATSEWHLCKAIQAKLKEVNHG